MEEQSIMHARIWGVGIILGLTLGIFSVGTALASGPLTNELLTIGSDNGSVNADVGNDSTAGTAASAQVNPGQTGTNGIIDNVTQTVSGITDSLLNGSSTPTAKSTSTPVATDNVVNTVVDTVNHVTGNLLNSQATSGSATASSTSNAASNVVDTVNEAAGNLLNGQITTGITNTGNAGATVDQTVQQGNNTVGQVTDNGQAPIGLSGVATSNSTASAQTFLSDPSADSLAKADACLNFNVLNAPIGTNCSNAQVGQGNGANVATVTGISTSDLHTTDTPLTGDLCLSANALNSGTNGCGSNGSDQSSNGLANVGLSTGSSGNIATGAGQNLNLGHDLCLDANLLADGGGNCANSSNGTAGLGVLGPDGSGILPVNQGSAAYSGLCLNLATLNGAGNCGTTVTGAGDNGNGGNGDNGNGGNGDNGNSGASDNGSGGTGDNGNGGTNHGSANGSTGNGGASYDGYGGVIAINFPIGSGNVSGNGSGDGTGNGASNTLSAASSTGLPSLMPSTGHPQASAIFAASHSSNTLLLTLIGLLFLFAGAVVTRRTTRTTSLN
jgi:hypothetical protein